MNIHPVSPEFSSAMVDWRALRACVERGMLRERAALRNRIKRLEELSRRGTDVSADLQKLLADAKESEAQARDRQAKLPRVTYPEELPISAKRADITNAVKSHQVVIVCGETGSGKTTQLPKICLELGRGVKGAIAHTQPRRLAARTVAERIADELDVPLGAAVGYAVRFSDRSREDTLLRLMTDGLLLAEIQHDRLL